MCCARPRFERKAQPLSSTIFVEYWFYEGYFCQICLNIFQSLTKRPGQQFRATVFKYDSCYTLSVAVLSLALTRCAWRPGEGYFSSTPRISYQWTTFPLPLKSEEKRRGVDRSSISNRIKFTLVRNELCKNPIIRRNQEWLSTVDKNTEHFFNQK